MEDFESYVGTAWPRLLRSAWLLTGDWHQAEDLVQTVLVRVHSKWDRIVADHPDAYVRKALANTYLSWWRRRWRGEIPTERLPDRPAGDPYAGSDLRDALARALASLPRQQRAVLMLRYHADLTEAQTADALRISVGSVKSYTARALARLREDPAMRGMAIEESTR